MSHTSKPQYYNFLTIFMTLIFLLCSIQSSYCLNGQRDREQSLPQDILDPVSKCLEDSSEDLIRVLFFLVSTDDVTRYLQILRSVKDNEQVLRGILLKLAENIKELEENEKFQEIMEDIWNNYLKPNLDNDFEYVQPINLLENSGKPDAKAIFEIYQTVSQHSSFKNLSMIGLLKTNAVNYVNEIAPSVLQHLNSASELAKTTLGKGAVGLATVYLSYDTYKNLQRWWKDEITGDRCAKNIIDSCVGVAAGVGGGFVGAAIGKNISPGLGEIVGAFIGGAISYKTAYTISDWATLKFFNLPKEEALENAYRFLELSYGASNNEINSNFNHLALVYHPERSGTYEKWHKLQLSMGLIKISKGESN